jgi:hypothetical protein
VPCAIDAGSTPLLFWVPSPARCSSPFVGTLAVNSWLIARGGHAGTHQYHRPSGGDADLHAGRSTGSTAHSAQHQETR